MLGEQPDAVDIAETGIVGDRAWGLVDTATGKVASAKYPRLWAALLGLRATYAGGDAEGPMTIELPDRTSVGSDDANADERLSAVVGRDVHLTATVPSGAA